MMAKPWNEEEMREVERELKMLSTLLNDYKKEKPKTSAQKLRWRNRLQRLRGRRVRLLDKLNELKDGV